MALINLSYCNVASGKTISLVYNDVTHTIDSHTVGANCASVQPGIIYSHLDGSFYYRVVPSNVAPYAVVSPVPVNNCLISILSGSVTNASLDTASNGAYTFQLSGNGLMAWSLDGINFTGNSGLFPLPLTGLRPGVYTLYARNRRIQGFTTQECIVTQQFTIGYNAIDCNTLALNYITYQGPTLAGGSNGTITVASVDALHPVEYRLNTGSWQSSNIFTGLTAGTYSVQVRYVGTACVQSDNVTLAPGAGCNLVINYTEITHEQSKFADDGRIFIDATSTATPLEYSKDGTTWQSSNIFQNLEPGTYTITVRDANTCTAEVTLTVLPFKTLYLKWPRVNSLRAVLTSGPLLNNQYQNFDNTLFAEMRFPGVEPCRYLEKVLRKDMRLQWRSSYSNHVLKVYTAAGVLTATVIPVKSLDYTQQTDSITNVAIANAGGGQAQVIFPNGLPTYLEIGQTITISGTAHAALNNSFEVTDIRAGSLLATGFAVAVIDVAWPTGNVLVQGNYSSVYDIEPFDVWEAVIPWPTISNGEYYFTVEATDVQHDTSILTSEPIVLASSHHNQVVMTYKGFDNSAEMFWSGIEGVIVVEAELRHPQPGGERTVMEDAERRLVKLQANMTRKPELLVPEIPYYLAERLGIAVDLDVVTANGVGYGIEDQPTLTHYDMDPLCTWQVRLREIDFTAENTDDQGDVDVPATVLEVNGVLLRLNP